MKVLFDFFNNKINLRYTAFFSRANTHNEYIQLRTFSNKHKQI